MRRLVVVGCGKSKLSCAAEARALYVGPLFRARRRYAEQLGDEWVILSALHGLVDPAAQLEPYDVTLAGMPPHQRDRLAWTVRDQLHALGGPRLLELHAGKRYADLLRGALPAGWRIAEPLHGVGGIGAQLGWYAARRRSEQLGDQEVMFWWATCCGTG